MRCFEIRPHGTLAQHRHLLVRHQHQANQLLSLVNCTLPLITLVMLDYRYGATNIDKPIVVCITRMPCYKKPADVWPKKAQSISRDNPAET